MAAYGCTIAKQLLWLKAKSFQPQNTFFSIAQQTQKHCANKPAEPNLSSLPPESLIPLE
jgi:hypothetical protein